MPNGFFVLSVTALVDQGASVHAVACDALALAKLTCKPVNVPFRGVVLTAYPGDTIAEVQARFDGLKRRV